MHTFLLLALCLISVAVVPTVVAVAGHHDVGSSHGEDMTKLTLGTGKWTQQERDKRHFDGIVKRRKTVPHWNREVNIKEYFDTQLQLRPASRSSTYVWDHQRLQVFNHHMQQVNDYDKIYRQQSALPDVGTLPFGPNSVHDQALNTCRERITANWNSGCDQAKHITTPAVQQEVAKSAKLTIDNLKRPVVRGDGVIEMRPITGGLHPPFTEDLFKQPRHS